MRFGFQEACVVPVASHPMTLPDIEREGTFPKIGRVTAWKSFEFRFLLERRDHTMVRCDFLHTAIGETRDLDAPFVDGEAGRA